MLLLQVFHIMGVDGFAITLGVMFIMFPSDD